MTSSITQACDKDQVPVIIFVRFAAEDILQLCSFCRVGLEGTEYHSKALAENSHTITPAMSVGPGAHPPRIWHSDPVGDDDDAGTVHYKAKYSLAFWLGGMR